MCGHSYFACAVCVGTCLAGGTVCVHVHPMGPLCRTMDTNMFKTAQSLAKPHKVAEWELYMALTTWLLTDHRQVCVCVCVCVCVYVWSVLWECVCVCVCVWECICVGSVYVLVSSFLCTDVFT